MAYPKTVKVQIQTMDLSVVKEKLKAIAILFPDHSDVSIKYHGWAITCDNHQDTVFADSGIIVDATKLGSRRFLAKVDGEWLYCRPTMDSDNDHPYWYLEFSTYLDVR